MDGLPWEAGVGLATAALIVPLALVVIGFVFTMQQDERQQKIEDQRAEADRELEKQKRA
jgi:uncharacterized protein HemX